MYAFLNTQYVHHERSNVRCKYPTYRRRKPGTECAATPGATIIRIAFCWQHSALGLSLVCEPRCLRQPSPVLFLSSEEAPLQEVRPLSLNELRSVFVCVYRRAQLRHGSRVMLALKWNAIRLWRRTPSLMGQPMRRTDCPTRLSSGAARTTEDDCAACLQGVAFLLIVNPVVSKLPDPALL